MNYRKVVPLAALFSILGTGLIWVLWPGSEKGLESGAPGRSKSTNSRTVEDVTPVRGTPRRPLLESGVAESASGQEATARDVTEDPVVVEEEVFDMSKDPEPTPDVSRETWSDPVNQRVLGERRWMPEPGQAELDRIDGILNTPMPATLLGVEAREQAISEMKWHIEACHTKFPTGGRLVVIWQISADGKLATSRDVRLGPVVDVVDERFLGCVVSFVPSASPTTERFQMTVEYPAFLDELLP